MDKYNLSFLTIITIKCTNKLKNCVPTTEDCIIWIGYYIIWLDYWEEEEEEEEEEKDVEL